jgi:hypothetical protein
MSPDPKDQPALKPIKPARIAQEVAKLSAGRRNGEFPPDMYDQKFARMIQELRERHIEGTRDEIKAALAPLVREGTITAAEQDRLLKQLGMA